MKKENRIVLNLANPAELSAESLVTVLRHSKQIESWLKAVKARLEGDVKEGITVEGVKFVAGRGTRDWSEPDAEVLAALQREGWQASDTKTKSLLLSVAKIEALVGKARFKELLGGMIVRHEGNPSLVHESDKREAITPGDSSDAAADAFKDLNG